MGSIPLPALQVQSPQVANPLELYQKAQQIKALMGQQQLQQQALTAGATEQQQRELQLRQQQREEADTKKFNQVFHDSGGDWDKTISSAVPAGVSPAYLEKAQAARVKHVQQAAENTKEQLANELAKEEEKAKSYQKVLSAAPEDQQTVYTKERNAHLLSGAYKLEEIPERMPPIDEMQRAANGSKAVQAILSDAAKLKQEQALTRETTAKATMAEQEAQLTPQERANLKAQTGASADDKRYEDIQSRVNQRIPVAPPELAWAKAYEKRKNLGAQFTFNLQKAAAETDQETLDRDAAWYNASGKLPPASRTAGGMQQQKLIRERAAQLSGGAPLAAGTAEYDADKKSLENIQKSFDQVTAFENTAGKNLDVFLNKAQKIVDSGVPVLNIPARMVASRLGGSQDQAAFEAARTTALTEIAKVLTNPGTSGQLSDSARHEVESLSPRDATLPQIMAVAKVLKQDMANRHQAYQDQITDIKGRLGGKPVTKSESIAPTKPAAATHTGVGSVDKKKHWLDANGKDLGLAE